MKAWDSFRFGNESFLLKYICPWNVYILQVDSRHCFARNKHTAQTYPVVNIGALSVWEVWDKRVSGWSTAFSAAPALQHSSALGWQPVGKELGCCCKSHCGPWEFTLKSCT